jgi:hypothetical protein
MVKPSNLWLIAAPAACAAKAATIQEDKSFMVSKVDDKKE